MISLRVTEIAVAEGHSPPLSEKRLARNCWPQAFFHCHNATELFPFLHSNRSGKAHGLINARQRGYHRAARSRGLHDQPLRMVSAIAITDCCVLRIEKAVMLKALHGQHSFSDLFARI